MCVMSLVFDDFSTPDCADPEKEKLKGRVAELEAKLNAVRDALGLP